MPLRLIYLLSTFMILTLMTVGCTKSADSAAESAVSGQTAESRASDDASAPPDAAAQPEAPSDDMPQGGPMADFTLDMTTIDTSLYSAEQLALLQDVADGSKNVMDLISSDLFSEDELTALGLPEMPDNAADMNGGPGGDPGKKPQGDAPAEPPSGEAPAEGVPGEPPSSESGDSSTTAQ